MSLFGPVDVVSRLVLQTSGNAPLNACTFFVAKRHGNVAFVLPRLAALGGFVVVVFEVRLLRAVFARLTTADGAIAAARTNSDSTVVARAAARVLTVRTVDQGNVVPQSIRHQSVLELSDPVSPETVCIVGNLERVACIKHSLGMGRTSGDGVLFLLEVSDHNNFVAAVVLDNGLASQSRCNKSLERNGAEDVEGVHG
jgi:hypothetical protein